MKTTLKTAFSNGLLHRIFFWIGFVSLFCAFFMLLLFPSFLDLFFFYFDTYIDPGKSNLIGVVCLVIAVFALLFSYFLPSKKHRYPASSVTEGSDRYLDQENGEFSSEEREAILQESWMSSAERFNRTRRA